MNWLGHNLASLRDALRRMLRSPLTSLFTALALGVAITLPSGLYLGLKNLQQLAGTLPAQPEISIFVSEKARDSDKAMLGKQLAGHPQLIKLHFVSSKEALGHLERQGLADLTAGLDSNPLPDTWVATLGNLPPDQIEGLKTELSALPGVESVLADSAWAARLRAILSIGRNLVIALSALFGLALMAITSNAIRAQILARRDEIEVSRLIGATDRFIRRPFLYFGALQGAVGALVALALTYLLGSALQQPVGQLASLYGSPFQLIPFSPMECGLLLAASVLFSWLGSWIAVSRILRQID